MIKGEKQTKEGEQVKVEEVENHSAAEKERVIVAPGEVIAEGKEFLPGEGTKREGNEIISLKFGLLEKQEKLVKVIPLSGAYIPRVGNTVIGEVIDVTFNGWIIDIGSPQLAFLPVAECFGYINKKDLTETFNFHDIIVTKIKSVKSRGVDLTMKERGLKVLQGGMLVKVNPTRVPRVIGRAGSMVNIIKEGTGCSVIVGQNGIIWLKGASVEHELLAKEAIELIVEKPFTEGLTEKVKAFLEKNKKEIKPKTEKKEVGERKEEK
ncbi:MAG: exosome complex RNA-binding protein Rrp4 [Candidatus Pacearchaeota archaeon]